MKLTVSELLGLVAVEVEKAEPSLAKSAAQKKLRGLHRHCRAIGVDGNEVTLESEEQVKKSSNPGLHPNSSASAAPEEGETD